MNDKKIQKVIIDCIELLDKGKPVEYCLKKYKPYKSHIQQYLELVGRLKVLGKIEPDDSFEKSALFQIYSQGLPTRRAARWLKPAIAFIAAFMLVTFSFAGTAYASQYSIPGEALYGVKRAVEDVQLLIYPQSKKGELHLRFLNRRIEEARIIILSEDATQELADEVMDDMVKQYSRCKKYGLSEGYQEEIIKDIESIKSGYQIQYGHGYKKGRSH